MDDLLNEFKQPKILLVDDNPDNLMVLRAILESPDYSLTDCLSGSEALGHLMSGEYALVLMDVSMPGFDGFETAKLIRSREKFRTLPIIFISASHLDEMSATKGYYAGAVDYITKPFNAEALKKKVEFFVNQTKGYMKVEDYNFFQVLNQVVNPLWAILLNVQFMKKLSVKDSQRLSKNLDKKLNDLENSTNKIRHLLTNLKIISTE